MKKLILGLLVFSSALSFSAERKVSVEQVYRNANTGIVYVQGEEKPYTGIIVIKYDNGKTQATMAYKDGVIHGKGETYYPSGKLQSKESYKNGKEDGLNVLYYENGNIEYEKNVSNNGRTVYEKHYFSSGKLDFEATYQDGKLDGVVKKYGENGEVIQQGTFKNGVQIK